MKEEWRTILGYEGLYSVSNLGAVRSEPRVIVKLNNVSQPLKGKPLNPGRDSSGYLLVGLHKGGTRKYYRIHRLVAEAFIDNPDEYDFVLHGENGIEDNSVNNLYWGDRVRNELDKRRDGTQRNLNKTECPRGHRYDGSNIYWSGRNKEYRTCWACKRAARYLDNNPSCTDTLKELSDKYYLRDYLSKKVD